MRMLAPIFRSGDSWFRRSCCFILRPPAAFSLVEVVLATAIVSFSMTTILALLPVGLNNLKESTDRDGVSLISQQVRADLEQISFTSGGSGAAVGDLPGKTDYYARNGTLVPGTANAYFAASYTVDPPTFPGATTTVASASRVVKLTVSYPFAAPAANRKSKVFSYLITKQ